MVKVEEVSILALATTIQEAKDRKAKILALSPCVFKKTAKASFFTTLTYTLVTMEISKK